MIMVDIPRRLRRAILQNDLPLVQRILKANPAYLQNTDQADKANTSLHLAAQNGFTNIAKHLISLGHDCSEPPGDYIYLYSTTNQGPSYNTDGHTPLHLASSHSHNAVVQLLCTSFPQLVNKTDNLGATPLHLASRAHPTPSAVTSTFATRISTKAAEDTSTISTLLAHKADVRIHDAKGNTCLHYASAWGNLKAVRVLIGAGADPLARNNDGWTPEYYSVTVQAEVYYRNLVAEWEKRRVEESVRMKEQRARSAAGVRLVTDDDGDESEELTFQDARDRASSGASRGTTGTTSTTAADTGLGLGIVGRTESWK